MNREEKIEHIRKGKFFAWGDAAVFAAAFLLIAVFTLFAFTGFCGAPADSFSVYYNNEKIFTASLSEDAVYEFYIEGGQGYVRAYEGSPHEEYNIIEVSGGKVSVREASCSDHVCVLFGATDSGEINCLPHRMRIAAERSEGGTDI